MTQDLSYLKKLRDTINQKLAQVNFEIGQEAYNITVSDKAVPPVVPSNNKRLVYMPVASAAILLLILGVFLVREIQANRGDEPVATA